jgi:hypothetical protein
MKNNSSDLYEGTNVEAKAIRFVERPFRTFNSTWHQLKIKL